MTNTTRQLHEQVITYNVNQHADPHLVLLTVIALAIIMVVISTSAVLFFWYTRQLKIKKLRDRLIPMYAFDPSEAEDCDAEPEQPYFSRAFLRQEYESMGNEEEQSSLLHG